jgi:hypothetical protein
MTKQVSLTLKGFMYEGKDCFIVKENNPLKSTIVGDRVEYEIRDFIDKNVEITITINIKETI